MMKSTKPMRDRAREILREARHLDDFDRAVICVMDDLEAILASQHDACEQAVERMGWPEIHAFNEERSKGLSVYEDAGGFVMRCIGRLFGVKPRDEVVSYQAAAKAMIDHARATR